MKANSPIDWVVSSKEGEPSFRWGYWGDDLVAEWEGVLTLRATRDGELKALDPVLGASKDIIEKTRLGVAFAFLRARRRQHSLHASAVSFEGKAIVCVGASGLGKSTIAERMCAHPGVELLADDTAAINLVPGDAAHVIPSESAVWLKLPGSGAKAPIRSLRSAAHSAALRYVVALAFDKDAQLLELRQLRGGDALSALLPSLVRFETSRSLWMRELDFLGELVSRSRVFRMRRSPEVTADIVADALFRLLADQP